MFTPQINKSDPEGNLHHLDDWSVNRARELAAGMGLTLSETHLVVLRFLREQYGVLGPLPARRTIQMLAEEYRAEGGKQFLYKLFPGGPVYQAYRIAGLPVPPNSNDNGFGSVM